MYIVQDTSAYSWVSGWYVKFTNWADGQPVATLGGGCVAMDENGEWSDITCGTALSFMCKTTTGGKEYDMKIRLNDYLTNHIL